MLDAIDALNIEKRNVSTEKKYNWNDKKYYIVDNVIGKTPKEASEILSKFKIEYSGSGNKIVEQSPSPNTKLEEESTVRLMLGN